MSMNRNKIKLRLRNQTRNNSNQIKVRKLQRVLRQLLHQRRASKFKASHHQKEKVKNWNTDQSIYMLCIVKINSRFWKHKIHLWHSKNALKRYLQCSKIYRWNKKRNYKREQMQSMKKGNKNSITNWHWVRIQIVLLHNHKQLRKRINYLRRRSHWPHSSFIFK